jgi:hypothetical protein
MHPCLEIIGICFGNNMPGSHPQTRWYTRIEPLILANCHLVDCLSADCRGILKILGRKKIPRLKTETDPSKMATPVTWNLPHFKLWKSNLGPISNYFGVILLQFFKARPFCKVSMKRSSLQRVSKFTPKNLNDIDPFIAQQTVFSLLIWPRLYAQAFYPALTATIFYKIGP